MEEQVENSAAATWHYSSCTRTEILFNTNEKCTFVVQLYLSVDAQIILLYNNYNRTAYVFLPNNCLKKKNNNVVLKQKDIVL